MEDTKITPHNVKLASRFKRWLASMINALLVYIMGFAFIYIFSLSGLNPSIGMLLGFITYFSLQFWLMKKYGQTLGKKLLNLQVVNWGDYQEMAFSRYVLREFTDIIFGIFSIPIIISAIMVFLNKERRSLADSIFSTLVISKN